MRALIVLIAATFVAAGCDNPNGIPAHSAADEKAISDYKSMTPQQRIDLIQKGSMPEAAKEAQIKKIKQANGMQ